MLTQPAVWAIIINNFTFHYAFYVVMNWLPTYFDKVCTPVSSLHLQALTDSSNMISGAYSSSLHTLSPQPLMHLTD